MKTLNKEESITNKSTDDSKGKLTKKDLLTQLIIYVVAAVSPLLVLIIMIKDILIYGIPIPSLELKCLIVIFIFSGIQSIINLKIKPQKIDESKAIQCLAVPLPCFLFPGPISGIKANYKIIKYLKKEKADYVIIYAVDRETPHDVKYFDPGIKNEYYYKVAFCRDESKGTADKDKLSSQSTESTVEFYELDAGDTRGCGEG